MVSWRVASAKCFALINSGCGASNAFVELRHPGFLRPVGQAPADRKLELALLYEDSLGLIVLHGLLQAGHLRDECFPCFRDASEGFGGRFLVRVRLVIIENRALVVEQRKKSRRLYLCNGL